jgi:ferredoxin
MTTWTVTIVVPADADVEQAGETVTVAVDEDQYVLAAAREAGLWLPADCQQGWCTTCAAKLIEGEVEQRNARRYYDVDESAGYVLPCVAKPRSDLTVEVGKMRELLELRAEHDLPPGNSKIDT